MTSQTAFIRNGNTRGFSLVEVTLALGVAGFCLVALFGLLPIGVSSNVTSTEQTAAASAAASIIADLRATPLSASATPSPQFSILVPVDNATTTTAPKYSVFLREDGTLALPAGAAPTPVPGNSVGFNADASQNPRYRVTLTFMPPPPVSTAPNATPAPATRAATPVRILVTWPALANPTASLDPALDNPPKYSGSFDVVTALDRH